MSLSQDITALKTMLAQAEKEIKALKEVGTNKQTDSELTTQKKGIPKTTYNFTE